MKLLMGNEAMAQGAIDAGVEVVTGYPGTPSSEVLEYIAGHNDGSIYAEWSINEKAAVEVAAGASLGGKRALVTMKQVGANAAADPIMNIAYIGAKAGLVILIADDPGPISSQTEQDTRRLGDYSGIPVLDPSSPQEAYDFMVKAFELSEREGTPVIIRPTTRVCHGTQSMELGLGLEKKDLGKFQKDPKWVIFPRLSYENHKKIVARNQRLAEDFSSWSENKRKGQGSKGIISQGVSYEYVEEILAGLDRGLDYQLLKIATPYPFPEKLVKDFAKGVDEILVIEELSPFIEEKLLEVKARFGLSASVYGKKTGHVKVAGENTWEELEAILASYFGFEVVELGVTKPLDVIRSPVLCAGCPHRGSFYAVKKAMRGKRAVFTGDIGCYTLGNAQPLDMVDTCLCMGAGITMAQGLARTEDMPVFAFIGDSTFFHSGLTGIANAIYNRTPMILVVLDNRTTAMTGKQPHPGTGATMMGEAYPKMDIGKVLEAMGVTPTYLDPFDIEASAVEVQKISEGQGVRAIIFDSPCIKLFKPETSYEVDREKCIFCKKCARETGCPALVKDKGKMAIDQDLCYGCSICEPICPTSAIKEVER